MHLASNKRGSATLRVLCAILGVLSIIFGLIVGVAGIAFLVDSFHDIGDIIASGILFVLTATLIGEGILMFVLPAQIVRLEKKTPDTWANVTDTTEPEIQTIPVGPAASSTAPTPASNVTQEASAAAAESTEHMIMRSDDIFATAKDIVRMHAANPERNRRIVHLATMLDTLGLVAWDSAPTCGVTKLSRTGNYWLRGNLDDLESMDPADYDRFTATEAALNIDQALQNVANAPLSSAPATEATRKYLQEIVDQQTKPYDFSASLDRAYPADVPQQSTGEWFLRANIVNDAECVRLPFRLLHDLRANAQAGTAVLNIEIPRPACFAVAVQSRSRRVAYARAYALRVSWLLASHAFQETRWLERMEVLCHEHGGTDVLLAIDFTRTLLERLAPVVHGSGIDESSFPQDAAITASFDDMGWFTPIQPPIGFKDELVAPKEWSVLPEMDARTLSPRCAQVAGARQARDLSINENGPRAHAATELIARWHSLERRSCADVVSTLVDVRNSASDVSIVEACDRATSALLDGSVDPSDDEALRSIIISDGTLHAAADRAYHLLENEDNADPEAAVTILREALDPIMSIGFYADDESCVYRYFGSVAERLVFNARIDDHRREVRLVPDSYYNALSFLSSALSSLGQNEEAASVADEMLRIAPASMDATMRKVRALENQSRVFEAAELIKAKAPFAITPRDAALAHYRLAYMEWKLGREDLAAACYQRALTWDTNLSEQARGELKDLFDSYPNLKQLNDEEVSAALANEEIPLGFTKADQDFLLTTVTLLVDEHVFVPAIPLLSVLCAADNDDVLVGIRRTLV